MSENLKNEKDIVIDDKEFDAAMEAAEEAPSAYTHVFSKPFNWMGKKYHELDFRWDELTGADFIAIENELLALGKPVITPEFSSEFLMRMASKSCGIGSDAFLTMPFGDFNKIRSAARNFMLHRE